VIFWGNSASTFSARHFAALVATPANLAAVVDVPAARRDTTNPLPGNLLDFTQEAHSRCIPAFEPGSPGEPGFIQALSELKPDLFLAAGYALILNPKVLSVPGILAANFHASLLPDYRGKHPVFWALRHGEKWAGLTIHAMDAGIDTGDILYQVKVRTRRDDSVASLYERIMARSMLLVEQLLTDVGRGCIPRLRQPAGEGSYFSSTTDVDFHLDWNWPAEKIRRHITITPGRCFVEIRGMRVHFVNAESEPISIEAAAGTLLQIGRARASVAANPGAVSSSRVQIAGSQEESFAGFCRRLELRPGDILTV
jgi:methionyl-tRNA formyltransferase